MIYRKEEARRIIYDALRELSLAKKDLESARNLGIVDLFGGKQISSILKHTKINDAQKHISYVQTSLYNYDYQLASALGLRDINIMDTNGFNSIMDMFFDNVFADASTQSKINDILNHVNISIDRMNYFLNGLY